MERIIKFEYIWSDGKNFLKHVFPIENIETGEPCDYLSDTPIYNNFKIVARRQWTEHNDKNGNPIFDGDILQLYMLHDGNPYHRIGSAVLKTTVSWNHDRCDWALGGKMAGLYEHLDEIVDHPEGIEIIGNIYENPELLTPLNK